jgi:branched-chain amino acid transport system ATP-binding protein/urea transport system ATP-binding protein
MLAIEGLESGYGGSRVLSGIALRVEQGESVALLGRNGMGKTTLLRSIMGLLPALSGEIRFAGERIDGRRPEAVAKAGIAFVPQGREIFAELSVEENLLLGAMGRGGLGATVPKDIYGRFPILWERRRQRGGTLSGGQQQQLAIGRALAGRPRLLLLDEPSEGLQPSIVAEVAAALRREVAEQGLTLITVEQNVDLALRVADRCLFIENGALVAEAASAELRRDPALIHRHLAI